MERGYAGLYVGRQRHRTSVVPVIMAVTALGIAIYLFIYLRPTVRGTIVDAYENQPVGNVTVALGTNTVRTNSKGQFTFTAAKAPTLLVVTPPDGYATAELEVPAGKVKNLTIPLRPTTISGTIVRKADGTPLSDIQVQAINDAGEATQVVVTGPDGRYSLTAVPPDARLVIAGPGFARREEAIGEKKGLDLELRPDIISGVVRGTDGKPIKGATVTAPGVRATATTAPNGSYTLQGVPENARATVMASGFTTTSVPLNDTTRQDFTLEPLIVRGIYLSAETVARDDRFNALVALADRTEVNAMVIDLKDSTGWVYYDSQNPLARAIGAVHPLFDVGQRLKVLKEHNIYAIARVVAMEDPTLAVARPELAIHNTTTGGIWKTVNGVAWVNAMRPEVWQYNRELAVEIAQLGFDEIQYDYVRFPSDGDLDAIDLGGPNTRETRTNAIRDFLATTHEALAPLSVALGVDIFGIAMWDPHDTGIGQQLEKIAAAVDYICPMIYPSHFFAGSMGFAIPNDHPYEVILQSLQAGQGRIDIPQRKLRPWLQDFSYGRGIEYGPEQVKAQIKATYDFGSTGWLLWNANNSFTEPALAPQPAKR